MDWYVHCLLAPKKQSVANVPHHVVNQMTTQNAHFQFGKCKIRVRDSGNLKHHLQNGGHIQGSCDQQLSA
jgi:hypothetical protein